MTDICGVCKEQQSKYNCPHCQLRYCSVKCFKEHIITHEDDEKEDKSEQGSSIPQLSTEDVGASLVPEDDDVDDDNGQHMDELTRRFEDAHNDRRLEYLFVKYPRLRSQLKEIYQLTIQPPEDQPSLPGQLLQKDFHRRPGLMSKGKWTQEKADKMALERLCEVAAQDQGLNEFMELSGLLLESDEMKQIQQHGVALLLSGE